MRRNWNKYRAIRCECDGIKFDSLKEINRYKELKLLERAKEIYKLELQPRFLILDGFEYEGKKEKAIYYVADFQYITKDGYEIVEDTKGFKTDVYKIKRKMFLFKYGERFIFRVVWQPFFRQFHVKHFLEFLNNYKIFPRTSLR
ncbi:DUF1064 domain-containing protein [Miniphocaeibacter halophilus]|uniref:DUF1064 domain-containing protein n=1 Tax=Miniphocaeibacter halophilus TaxID=2931922 RepID=A0AC61MSZ6_9FIRM|nr:DUF1064 domain-containing protein [Miniphocaeibacter halophilus]QQK07725.1 DUF1064 domain-containing protein [Miniphocaeibacter halophilus]